MPGKNQEMPKKKAGDSLSHMHVNALSDAARGFNQARGGSYLSGRKGLEQFNLSGAPGGCTLLGRISNRTAFTDDTETSGYYLIRIWFFDGTAGAREWVVFNDKEWTLDATSWGDTGCLPVGITLMITWDQQRGLFIPLAMPSIIRGTLDEDLTPGDSAPMSVYLGAPLTVTDETVTVYDDMSFITADYYIPAGRAITASYHEGRWQLLTIKGCEEEEVSSDSSSSSQSV